MNLCQALSGISVIIAGLVSHRNTRTKGIS